MKKLIAGSAILILFLLAVGISQAQVLNKGFTRTFSDIRLKKNLEPLSNSLRNLLQIQGYYHEWDIENHPEMNFEPGRKICFIAQQVEEFYPELVYQEENGYKSLDYDKIAPVLVEAIKEQQRIIEEQKVAITNMEERLAKLEMKQTGSDESSGKPAGIEITNVYPNPAKSKLCIAYFKEHEGEVNLEVVDVLGRTLKHFSAQGREGMNQTTLPIEDLPEGAYSIFLKSEFDRAALLFIKKD